jgi:hypothetical protein
MSPATPPRLVSELTFRETTYTISDRPSGIVTPTRHWWLEFDGAWFQVAKRSTDDPPIEAIRVWIYANVIHPDEDAHDDERGPAWTTTEHQPLVFVDGDTNYAVWADAEVQPSTVSPEGLHWIVSRSGGRRPVAMPLDVDDTIVQLLRSVRSSTPPRGTRVTV